jgi:2-isopropylmalate synthase
LRKTKEEILEIIKNYLRKIVDLFGDIPHIMFSPEDALRTEKDFLFEVIEVATKNGAKIINIPDTVGYAQVLEMRELIQELTTRFPNVIFSVHCHNDL